MDKAQARALQDDAHAALKVVFAKYGMTIVKGHSSYDVGAFRMTVTANANDPALDPKRTDWKKYADSYRLPADALGKTVTIAGVDYRIDGLVVSRRKYPVAVTRLSDGKSLLMTVRSIKPALGVPLTPYDLA